MDRINMNVFRQIREKKKNKPAQQNVQTKTNSTQATQITKPATQVTKNTNTQITKKQPAVMTGKATKTTANPTTSIAKQMNSLNLNENNLNEFPSQVSTSQSPKIFMKKDITGITTLQAMVKDPNNPNNAEAFQYKIRTKKAEDPILDFDNLPVKGSTELKTKNQTDLEKAQNMIFLNAVKSNKLTWGTQQMMDNEKVHAQEAIESGIYVTWSTKTQGGNIVDCFRVGTNSMCICSHGFTSHDKVLTKKKLSCKCNECKCKAFTYIPQYPEEIGEYWMPYQKNFEYKTWRGKCKCKHGWNEHSVSKNLQCTKCNCYSFYSNFCCAVCNKFWQDHEMIYELEHERYMNNKPVGQDYIPFAEMPEMHDALYNK